MVTRGGGRRGSFWGKFFEEFGPDGWMVGWFFWRIAMKTICGYWMLLAMESENQPCDHQYLQRCRNTGDSRWWYKKIAMVEKQQSLETIDGGFSETTGVGGQQGWFYKQQVTSERPSPSGNLSGTGPGSSPACQPNRS